jgi:hypothetical protein
MSVDVRMFRQYILTMVLVAFCAFFRYDDLQRLQRRDVRFFPDHAELFVFKRKNDQLREGDVVWLLRGESVVCPVGALEWLFRQSSTLWASPSARVFQRFDGVRCRWHPGQVFETMVGEEFPYHQLQDPLRRLLSVYLREPEEAVRKRIGTQSLRSGGATTVAARGVSDRLFQAHGGWRTVAMKDHYVKDTAQAKLSVTMALGY